MSKLMSFATLERTLLPELQRLSTSDIEMKFQNLQWRVTLAHQLAEQKAALKFSEIFIHSPFYAAHPGMLLPSSFEAFHSNHGAKINDQRNSATLE